MTTTYEGRNGLIITLENSAPTYPLPVIDQHVSIAKTVDGNTLTLTADADRAGCWIAMSHAGFSFLHCPDHGMGVQSAFYPLPDLLSSGVPNEYGFGTQGSDSRWDPVPTECKSDQRARSIHDLAGPGGLPTGLTCVNYPGFWLPPGESIPGWESRPALNQTIRSHHKVVTRNQIGWNGNDHIISCDVSVEIAPTSLPVVEQWPKAVMCPICMYLPKSVFDAATAFEIDPTDGTYSSIALPPINTTYTTSTTKPRMTANAAGTVAAAVYMPSSQFTAATSRYGLWHHSGGFVAMDVFDEPLFPSGMPAGTYNYPNTVICWATGVGAKDTVAAAVNHVFLNAS